MTARLFTKRHAWVQFTGEDTALIGVTPELVERWKKPVCINLCDEGDVLRAGDNAGDVEFLKGVVDFYTPVSGTVDAVNDRLLERPELLGSEPYAWLCALQQARADKPLLTESEYARYVRAEAP